MYTVYIVKSRKANICFQVEDYFRRDFFVWRPRKMWDAKFACLVKSADGQTCEGLMMNKGWWRTPRKVLNLREYYLLITTRLGK